MNTQTDSATGRRRGPEIEEGHIDLAEQGRGSDGSPLALDRRLFMQFLSFRNGDAGELAGLFEKSSAQAVLYRDLNDPNSLGILVYCEDPGYVLEHIHPLLRSDALGQMTIREEYTMLGRTYSIGYEADLEEVLIRRPARRICDPATPWAVFYPVRRSGEFEQQSKEEQRKMLMEHGGIGHAFGNAGFASDIRLAAHGMNKDDSDFIIGLLGRELFPLSALVQRMRRTRQTSAFIRSMGPFFVGKAIWQPKFDEAAKIS